MHVIVCGLGHIGYRGATLLARLGATVSVVCRPSREDWIRAVEAAGGTVIVGDARDPALLAKAGLATCDAIIAATDSDVVNLEIALDARRAREDVAIVVRMFDATLAEEVEHSLAVRRALSVSSLAAPAFAGAAIGDRIRGVLSFGEERFVLGEPSTQGGAEGENSGADLGDGLRLVPERSWHKAAPIGEREKLAKAQRKRASVVRLAIEVWQGAPPALRRVLASLSVLMLISVFVFGYGMNLKLLDAFYFLVTTVTTTGYGDISPKDAAPWLKLYACTVMILGSFATATLYSMITDFVLAERFASALGRTRVPLHGHVVIVGIGNLGYRIAEELARAGVPTAAVDVRPAVELSAGLGSTPLMIGDGRLDAVLLEAHAEGARALVAVTGDDAVNLAVGLASVRKRKIPAVVRLFDADFARKASSLSLRAALSASALAAPSFVASALFDGVRYAFVTREELVAICDVAGPPSDHPEGEVVASHGGRSLIVRRARLQPAPSLVPMM